MTNQERALKLLTRAMLEFGAEMNYEIGFAPKDEGSPYVNVMECEACIAQVYFELPPKQQHIVVFRYARRAEKFVVVSFHEHEPMKLYGPFDTSREAYDWADRNSTLTHFSVNAILEAKEQE
jgi:hypothetical protein